MVVSLNILDIVQGYTAHAEIYTSSPPSLELISGANKVETSPDSGHLCCRNTVASKWAPRVDPYLAHNLKALDHADLHEIAPRTMVVGTVASVEGGTHHSRPFPRCRKHPQVPRCARHV